MMNLDTWSALFEYEWTHVSSDEVYGGSASNADISLHRQERVHPLSLWVVSRCSQQTEEVPEFMYRLARMDKRKRVPGGGGTSWPSKSLLAHRLT